ncbi:MAG TPA: 2-hydroxyacid dehydrogenase [Geminicoccaceae bacterium]
MRILLNGSIARTGEDHLRSHFGDAATVQLTGPDDGPDDGARKFGEAEILVTVGYDAETPPAPNLRLIHVPASGLDEIDFQAVPDGVPVCNAFEHDSGIAEHVLAAILQFAVDLPGRDRRFRSGSWADSPRMGAAGRPELTGQTLGCIGYGSIARAVATRARAFDMRIAAATRAPRSLDPEPDVLVGFDRIGEVLEQADFLVIACPLTPATTGLIGPGEIDRMKRSLVLINVARGPIVDEQALFEALREERIAGAAIDVWYRYPSPGEPEPRPSSLPFHELDNVIMTPHCSGWTAELMRRRFAVIIDNIERLRAGRPLRNQVWPKAGAL